MSQLFHTLLCPTLGAPLQRGLPWIPAEPSQDAADGIEQRQIAGLRSTLQFEGGLQILRGLALNQQADASGPEPCRAFTRWRSAGAQQQAQQAYTTLEQALAQASDDPDLLTEQSLVLEKLRRFDDMEAVLRKLMRLRPQDAHAYNALGYSLADRSIRLDEAQTLILKAVELAPDDPFIQDSLGWVAFRMGRLDEALRVLRAAYQARPDAEIAAHLGEVLWSLERRSEAASIWREGLLLKSDNETLIETMKRLGFKP